MHGLFSPGDCTRVIWGPSHPAETTSMLTVAPGACPTVLTGDCANLDSRLLAGKISPVLGEGGKIVA